MDDDKLVKEACAIFDSLSSEDGTLFHIMNARKENTAPDYDGDRFLEEFSSGQEEDFNSFGEAVELFKKHSVSRK